MFHKTNNIKNIPLIKYVGMDGNVEFFPINEGTNKVLSARSACFGYVSWLINWNKEFQGATDRFFLPIGTQEAIRSSLKEHTLVKWLQEELEVKFLRVNEYAEHIISSLDTDRKLAVTYAHFVNNSVRQKYLLEHEVKNLCSNMPIVDSYGRVTTTRSGVLVPANGSKWVELIGSNPWRKNNFVELGEDYTRRVSYFGIVTSGDELVSFMRTYVGASDVPKLSAPNAAIPTMSSPLTKSNTFLLLSWLDDLRRKRVVLPKKFLSSIKNGSWMKISLCGSSGYRPPSESFMLDSSNGHLLQNGSVLVDIPLVDEKFYGVEIKKDYKDELKEIGVRFENKEACEFIGKRLMSLAASSNLTRDNVVSILKFIRFLGNNVSLNDEFVNSIKGGKRLRTSRGDMMPGNSVLLSPEWSAAKEISNIPFIDQDYYGKELLSFKNELKQLGVVVNFDQSCYQLVSDNLKTSSSFTSISSEAILLILTCIQKLESQIHWLKLLKTRNV